MTTDTSGKINHSWNISQDFSTATRQARGLWAFDDCIALPLPRRRLLLKSKRTDNRVVVDTEAFQLLQLCRQFRTLEEHIAIVKQVKPALAEHRPEIAQIFNQCIERGFMISAKSLIAGLQQRGKAPYQAPLFGILVRTCDRPKQLARLMKSFAEHQVHHGRRYRYLVMDDSKNSNHLAENQAVTERLRKEAGLDIHYHGWEQQQKLITALSSAFPEQQEAIQWLLGGSREDGEFSGGRLWNYMLLLTAGKRFLTIDDDMVCQPRLAPGHQNSLEISGRQREVHFFLNRDELLANTAVSNLDPIAQHSDILGGSIGATIRNFSAIKLDEQAFKHLSSEQADTLHADAKILLTQCGIFGDPGTASNHWVYELEGEARSQLVANPEAYEVLRAGRHVWLGSSSFHFLPTTSLLSTLTGFDNQQMLPCTGPRFRNEDHLFGTLVKVLYPTSLALDFPWGLLHFPEPERPWRQENLDQPESVGVLGFLADIASNSMENCYASGGHQRLTFLAETYLALADASDTVLAAGIEENLLHARVGKINHLQAQLDIYHSQPSYWANDVKRLLQAGSNALINREDRLIPEASAGGERSAQIALVRTTLRQFGSALKIWPQLWKFCKENNGD